MTQAAIRHFYHMRRLALQWPISQLFLVIGCVLYAGFSEPTPPRFHVVEAGVALCFFISLFMVARSWGAMVQGGVIAQKDIWPLWYMFGMGFLAFSLFLPLWIGIGAGRPMASVLRDMIGLAFWALPLLFWPYIMQDRRRHEFFVKTITASLLIIGLFFSARFLWSLYLVTGIISIAPSHRDILLELVNVPSVLFAALYLAGQGFLMISRPIMASKIRGGVYLTLSILPITAGICALQRANLGALIMLLCLIFIWQIWRHPRRILWLIAPICLAFIVTAGLWGQVAQVMIEKTRLVGFNMRFEEAEAVLNHMVLAQINDIWHPYIFGLGWGASFISPAAGFIDINYTHNMMMTLWLKTGLIGVFLGGAYLFLMIKQAVKAAIHAKRGPQLVVLYATLMPVLINVFLYANHKSFDFGLMLVLLISFTALLGQNQSKNSDEK